MALIEIVISMNDHDIIYCFSVRLNTKLISIILKDVISSLMNTWNGQGLKLEWLFNEVDNWWSLKTDAMVAVSLLDRQWAGLFWSGGKYKITMHYVAPYVAVVSTWASSALPPFVLSGLMMWFPLVWTRHQSQWRSHCGNSNMQNIISSWVQCDINIPSRW